jgi:putrescine transport system substrate-binding protein
MRNKLNYAIVITVLLAGINMYTTAKASNNSSKLNIYNWSNYIAPDTIRNFEKETGIKVRYDDTLDSNETLHTKLITGNSGYDLVVPSSGYARLDIKAGLLQKLDKRKISNWKNQDPLLLSRLISADPNNQYLVIWRWGYTTIGINKQSVAKELGSMPMPENSWDLVFDPKYAKLMSKCGITLIDAASDNIPPALAYLGLNPASINPSDYKLASKLWRSVRPYITKISSTGWIDDLTSNTSCVVLAYSGDINIARENSIKNKSKFDIEALVPKTGAFLFFDTMAIPKDAANVGNALKFINYILDPKVSGNITNTIFYPGPVPSSIVYTKKSVAENRSVFLAPSILANMAPPILLNTKIRTLQMNAWTEINAGQ